MRILKKGNSNTKSLAYMFLVLPILEYGAACWDPCREGQISALDRVKKKAAKFVFNHICALDRSLCLYSIIYGLFGDKHLHKFDLPKDESGGRHFLF